MALMLQRVPLASQPPVLCPRFAETGPEKGCQDLGMIQLGLSKMMQWATK